jgi:hypothetical protein
MKVLKYFNEYCNLNESIKIGDDFHKFIMNIENLGELVLNDLLHNQNCKITNNDTNELSADVDDETSSLSQIYELDVTFTYNYHGKQIPLILYSEGDVLFHGGTLDKDTNDVPGTGWDFKGKKINIENFTLMLDSEFDTEIDISEVNLKTKEKLVEKLVPWI